MKEVAILNKDIAALREKGIDITGLELTPEEKKLALYQLGTIRSLGTTKGKIAILDQLQICAKLIDEKMPSEKVLKLILIEMYVTYGHLHPQEITEAFLLASKNSDKVRSIKLFGKSINLVMLHDIIRFYNKSTRHRLLGTITYKMKVRDRERQRSLATPSNQVILPSKMNRVTQKSITELKRENQKRIDKIRKDENAK